MLVACALLGPLVTPAPALAQARERELYVSVVDQQGAPAMGLGPDDFEVREDGVRREVLRVTPATDPMQIALLIDNSQAATDAIKDIRSAVLAFVETMIPEGHQIALITFGERPTIVTEYTTSTAELKRGVGRLFARPGSGAHLLDAVADAAQGVTRREATRPVIVAITTEGIEFSNLRFETVRDELLRSGAALHALVLVGRTVPDLRNEEIRNRNLLIDHGTRATGGRRETLLTVMALEPQMKELAAELLNQYKVVYARPDALIPPDRVEVRTPRPGLTARGTPARVGGAR
jgi:VWFA-related protein